MSRIAFKASETGTGSVTFEAPTTDEDIVMDLPSKSGGLLSTAFNVATRTVSENTTATEEDMVINVNADTATITIPEGLDVGKRLLIRKIHETQGAVTLARSGSEVFTRAELEDVSLNADGDFWLIEKVSATRWDLVDGCQTGTNASGKWVALPNGELHLYSPINLTWTDSGSGYLLLTWSFPKVSVVNVNVAHTWYTSTATGNTTKAHRRWPRNYTEDIEFTTHISLNTSHELNIQAFGRWYL